MNIQSLVAKGIADGEIVIPNGTYQDFVVTLIRVSQLISQSPSQRQLNGMFDNIPILLIHRRKIYSPSKMFTH